MPARREVLAGLGAMALTTTSARASVEDQDASAVARLDRAATQPPASALVLVDAIDPTGLTPARRLDVGTARAGLAIDIALAADPGDYGLRVARTLGDPGDLDRVRARLDRELAALTRQAAGLFHRIGLSRATIGESYVALFADDRFLYPDSDAGRTAALDDMRRHLARLRGISARAIAGMPGFGCEAAVRALTPAEIAAGKGGYREPPRPDRAGAYVVDLKDIRRRPRWSLPSVVAHELLPGHMPQLAFEVAMPPHASRITYAAAFFEGWAIHAERIAAAQGAFADPRDMLGHLHWLIFRAARARVDLGLHRDGWSVAEARARLVAWQGEPAYFAPFDTDVARIVREPGLRLAEALAWLALDDRAPTASARPRWYRTLLATGRRRL